MRIEAETEREKIRSESNQAIQKMIIEAETEREKIRNEAKT